MNKREVADELECSTRQVEKYVGLGRLHVVEYVRGKTGREGVYDSAEVAHLKAELERERAEVIGHAATFAGVQALQRAGGEQGMSMLASVLADALRAAHAPADGAPPVPLRDKMTLSFKEAALLSGVPESHLREGYARGILRGAKIGRGVRVTPDDVRKYVEERMKSKR
jgi:excisionase family DNA binding protein